jgi:hypothetical protein
MKMADLKNKEIAPNYWCDVHGSKGESGELVMRKSQGREETDLDGG